MVSQRLDRLQEAPDLKLVRLSAPLRGVCHLELNRPPVNALNTALWSELRQALDYLEHKQFPHAIRVLVISSAMQRAIFSAGNDLTELHAPSTSEAQFITFWITSTNFLARLYKSPLYTIAAIRGATPAGGCVISMCCDRRIAQSNTIIGLNEVSIGLPVPSYWARLFLLLVTPRWRGEAMLSKGEMVRAEEAKELGLVDQVVEGEQALLQRALELAAEWARQKDVSGRVQLKESLRAEFANAWDLHSLQAARSGWAELSKPARASVLGAIMKQLAQSPSAKM